MVQTLDHNRGPEQLDSFRDGDCSGVVGNGDDDEPTFGMG